MAHLVESMFSYREVPWHGLGVIVEDAPDSKEAIELAGLNWLVEQKRIKLENDDLIENFFANVRSTDDSVLGIVGNKYSIVQNHEAFEFTDGLLGQGVRYETAGSLMSGRKVWLLAKLEDRHKILGDDINTYLTFYNSHDGKGSVRVFVTPVRVVCNNTLNLALSTAKRSWSTIHVGSIQEKLQEAARTLELTHIYMEQLSKQAETFANKSLNDDQVMSFIEELFPFPENEDELTERKKKNILEARDMLYQTYDKTADLQPFKGTAWGLLGAVSDFVCHAEPLRKTSTFAENRFDKIITGHPVLDKATELLMAA